jgi:hypothetical protein
MMCAFIRAKSVANAHLMWLKQILSALATVSKRNFAIAEAQTKEGKSKSIIRGSIC